MCFFNQAHLHDVSIAHRLDDQRRVALCLASRVGCGDHEIAGVFSEHLRNDQRVLLALARNLLCLKIKIEQIKWVHSIRKYRQPEE